MTVNIYDYDVDSIEGASISLNQYRDKVLLIVNTASACGYSNQFNELQTLYDDYKIRGFEVLAFPCNQFKEQEPGDSQTIEKICHSKFKFNYPLFSKVEVKGKNAHPLFQHLIRSKRGFITRDIKWNFTKFLIDKNGIPVKRYGTLIKPQKIEKDILRLL